LISLPSLIIIIKSPCHLLKWQDQGLPGELEPLRDAQQLLTDSVAGDMAEPNPTIPAQGKLPLSPASGQANHQTLKSSFNPSALCTS
jgi:hypothetical protein